LPARGRSISLRGDVHIGQGVHPEASGQGGKPTTCLDVVPRLRMSGGTPLLPAYAFMECTGTVLIKIHVLPGLTNRIRSEHLFVSRKYEVTWNIHPSESQGGFKYVVFLLQNNKNSFFNGI
jgi:hypothetical protein